jgi:hypothetical protein
MHVNYRLSGAGDESPNSVFQIFAEERRRIIAIGVVFLLSRLALLWYNDAEFTDAYEFIRWSLGQPGKRHPLYPMLIDVVSSAMDPIVAGRLISSLAGLLCLPSIAALSRRLYGSAAGWIACLLFTVSAQVLFFTSRVLSETLFLCVCLPALLYFIRSLEEDKARNLAWLMIFSGLAALIRPEALIFLPLILVALLSHIHRKLWKNLVPVVPALIFWFLYFLWSRYFSNLGYQSEIAFSLKTGTTAKFLSYLFAYIDVYPYSAFYPVFLLAFLGIFGSSPQPRSWVLLLLYIHVAIFLVITIHQAWSTRFLLLPVILILITAAGMLRELGRKMPIRRWITLLICTTLSSLAFGAWALHAQKQTYSDIKDSAVFLHELKTDHSIYSDETIKITYYLGRDVNTYRSNAEYRKGDIITLHSFHTPLLHELHNLSQRYQLQYLFTSESHIRPVLANTLLERQQTNLPVALLERFRLQNFYSVVVEVIAEHSAPRPPSSSKPQ